MENSDKLIALAIAIGFGVMIALDWPPYWLADAVAAMPFGGGRGG